MIDIKEYFELWLKRLETYYDRRFEDLDTKTTLALSAADKAVSKAEIATEKRFEGVNEFRQTLADQASRLMPRQEALSKFENIQKDITTLDKAIQELRERGSNITGRDLQRDQIQQDVSKKQSWFFPMIVSIGLGLASLLIALFK